MRDQHYPLYREEFEHESSDGLAKGEKHSGAFRGHAAEIPDDYIGRISGICQETLNHPG